jgi:hypothetical protein
MAELQKTGGFKEKLLWGSIGIGLKTLAITLQRTSKKDKMLNRALDEFTGVYKFENRDGSQYRYLVFRGRGKVASPKKWNGEVDFTLTLRDPKAFNRRSRAENVLETVIANKIGQSGNMYYIYQFGFTMSLLERYFRSKRKSGAKA